MPRFAFTGMSLAAVAWSDEEERQQKEVEASFYGEVRFLGIEDGRPTMLIIVDAADQTEAWSRGEQAAHAIFGRECDLGGCTPIIEPVDPFPDHPAAAS